MPFLELEREHLQVVQDDFFLVNKEIALSWACAMLVSYSPLAAWIHDMVVHNVTGHTAFVSGTAVARLDSARDARIKALYNSAWWNKKIRVALLGDDPVPAAMHCLFKRDKALTIEASIQDNYHMHADTLTDDSVDPEEATVSVAVAGIHPVVILERYMTYLGSIEDAREKIHKRWGGGVYDKSAINAWGARFRTYQEDHKSDVVRALKKRGVVVKWHGPKGMGDIMRSMGLDGKGPPTKSP